MPVSTCSSSLYLGLVLLSLHPQLPPSPPPPHPLSWSASSSSYSLLPGHEPITGLVVMQHNFSPVSGRAAIVTRLKHIMCSSLCALKPLVGLLDISCLQPPITPSHLHTLEGVCFSCDFLLFSDIHEFLISWAPSVLQQHPVSLPVLCCLLFCFSLNICWSYRMHFSHRFPSL